VCSWAKAFDFLAHKFFFSDCLRPALKCFHVGCVGRMGISPIDKIVDEFGQNPSFVPFFASSEGASESQPVSPVEALAVRCVTECPQCLG
jgi:hypothetical protein